MTDNAKQQKCIDTIKIKSIIILTDEHFKILQFSILIDVSSSIKIKVNWKCDDRFARRVFKKESATKKAQSVSNQSEKKKNTYGKRKKEDEQNNRQNEQVEVIY